MRKLIKGTAFLLCVVLTVGMLMGCKANISSYADEKITIVGLTDEEFTITPADLAELECEEAKAVGETKKAGTVKAYGPTLETFLEQYDVTLDQLYSIRFTAKDDYTVKIGANTWDQYTVYLSIANGWKKLYEKQRPLRVVIPGSSSGNWVYSVTKIEFTFKDAGE